MIPPIELQFKQPARTPEATPNSASSAASASASAAPCTSSNVPATHHHSHSAPTSPAAGTAPGTGALKLSQLKQLDLLHITKYSTTIHTIAREILRAERTSKFYVGQWIDVKDTVNQWLEATVMEVFFRMQIYAIYFFTAPYFVTIVATDFRNTN